MSGQLINNRELASLIWLIAIVLLLLMKKDVRGSLAQLFKTFFSPQILVPFAIFCLYIALLCVVFEHFLPWGTVFSKEMFYWSLGTAAVLFFTIKEISTSGAVFFKSIVKKAVSMFSFTAIFAFLLDFYVGSLVAELLIVPAVGLVVLLNAVAGYRLHARIKKATDVLLSLMGVAMISYVATNLLFDYAYFLRIETLSTYVAPAVMTVALVPFLYLLALYVAIDSLVRVASIKNRDRNFRRRAALVLIREFGFNLNRLNAFSKTNRMRLYGIGDSQNLIDLIQEHKQSGEAG